MVLKPNSLVKLRNGKYTIISSIDKTLQLFPVNTHEGKSYTLKGKFHDGDRQSEYDIVLDLGPPEDGTMITINNKEYVAYGGSIYPFERINKDGQKI